MNRRRFFLNSLGGLFGLLIFSWKRQGKDENVKDDRWVSVDIKLARFKNNGMYVLSGGIKLLGEVVNKAYGWNEKQVKLEIWSKMSQSSLGNLFEYRPTTKYIRIQINKYNDKMYGDISVYHAKIFFTEDKLNIRNQETILITTGVG